MDFLGIDIYLMIVIVAAIFVAGVIWLMSRNLVKKPGGKIKIPALKSTKSVREKPKKATKKVIKKLRPAPVSEQASKKNAVVPVAVKEKAPSPAPPVEEGLTEPEETEDLIVGESEFNLEPSLEKDAKGKIDTDKDKEEEDYDSIATAVSDAGNISSDMHKLDKIPDSVGDVGTGYLKDEDIDDQPQENHQGSDNPAENMESQDTIQDQILDTDSDDEEEENKEGGGLLDIFEEEDDEDNPVTQLAAKMEDVDTESLEEIGKEISRSLLNR